MNFIADVRPIDGKFHLLVAGIILATQGDLCRDPAFNDLADDFPRPFDDVQDAPTWNEPMLRAAAKRINGAGHPETDPRMQCAEA